MNMGMVVRKMHSLYLNNYYNKIYVPTTFHRRNKLALLANELNVDSVIKSIMINEYVYRQ